MSDPSRNTGEGQKPASAAQDLPGAVDGAVRETRSDCADEAQVTYPPSPPSPASPAPWDEDTMIIHHVLPGVAGTSGPAAASLDSVAEPVQELDEEPGEAVPQTRGMGGRSMSGSSVRFQQEPDVVHFDTDSPAREDRLAIAAPEAVADPPVTAVTAPAAEAEAQVPEASAEPAAKAEAQEPEATVEPSAEAEAQDPEAVIEPEPAKLLVPEPDITDTPQPLADAAREKVAGNLPTSVAEATTDTPPKMEVEVVETQPDSVEGAPGPIEAPKEAEDAQAVAKPSLAAAAGLATAKTPSKAEGVKPTSGKVPKAGMTAQTVSAAAKRRPAPKAASVPKAAPHTKKEVAAKPTPPAPKAAPPVAKATPSTGKAAAAKPKAAQRRARSHDERQQRQPGSRRHSAEVSKAMSDALSAAAQEKPKPAWGGSGKLVTRPAAEVRRASPRPKAMNSKPTKAASFADLRPAPEKLGSAQPPAQEKAPSQVVSQAKASSKRRVSEGEAALEKMAKDLEKNVKAAQALCLRESEKCAVRHMKAAEAEAAAVRQAMALQAAVSAPPQSPIKDTKESESPAIPAEPVSQRSGSLRLALADLVQQEDTDDAQLAMAVQRVLGDSLPSSPSHSSSRHSGLLTQSSPQLLVSHEVPLRIGSRPRSASGSPRHSHKELPTQDEGAKKKVVKSSPAHRPGRGEDSPPRAGSPPHRSQQCQPATASKMTPRKKVDIRPAWDDRFYLVEAKKHQLRKSELDELKVQQILTWHSTCIFWTCHTRTRYSRRLHSEECGPGRRQRRLQRLRKVRQQRRGRHPRRRASQRPMRRPESPQHHLRHRRRLLCRQDHRCRQSGLQPIEQSDRRGARLRAGSNASKSWRRRLVPPSIACLETMPGDRG
eukprot:s1318_g2.t1